MKLFLDDNFIITEEKTEISIDINVNISPDMLENIKKLLSDYPSNKRLENTKFFFYIFEKISTVSNNIIPTIKTPFTNEESFSIFLKTCVRKTQNLFFSMTDKMIVDCYTERYNKQYVKDYKNLLEKWAIENNIVYRKTFKKNINFFGIEIVSN